MRCACASIVDWALVTSEVSGLPFVVQVDGRRREVRVVGVLELRAAHIVVQRVQGARAPADRVLHSGAGASGAGRGVIVLRAAAPVAVAVVDAAAAVPAPVVPEVHRASHQITCKWNTYFLASSTQDVACSFTSHVLVCYE